MSARARVRIAFFLDQTLLRLRLIAYLRFFPFVLICVFHACLRSGAVISYCPVLHGVLLPTSVSCRTAPACRVYTLSYFVGGYAQLSSPCFSFPSLFFFDVEFRFPRLVFSHRFIWWSFSLLLSFVPSLWAFHPVPPIGEYYPFSCLPT